MVAVRTIAAAAVAAALAAGTSTLAPAQGQTAAYEVWLLDQADAARGGARLYIFDGTALEAGQAGSPEMINLDAAAAGVGDGPGVRPHWVAFTASGSHAVIANVASGHIYVMRASDRKIVASIDVGEQAHQAEVSPDGTVILVANSNGKRLARIRADFAAQRFTYDRGDDLTLEPMQDAGHPDNAAVCVYPFGDRAYVTLRGGGLYVVDYRSTPMRVVQSYSREQIAPVPCFMAATGRHIYVSSGTATSSSLYVFDAASHALIRGLNFAWAGAAAHGLTIVGGYLWMVNQADRNIVIVSTVSQGLAGFLPSVGGTPDTLAAAPTGRFVYASMRGPNNLSGGPTEGRAARSGGAGRHRRGQGRSPGRLRADR